MATLYENIVYLCQRNGIKGGKMCADTGISKGLLTDLKMGRRTGVSATTAQKIANYFGVTVGFLLGEEEEKEIPAEQNGGYSEEELMLLEWFRKDASPTQKAMIRLMFEDVDRS